MGSTVDRGLPAITARLSYAFYYPIYLYYRDLMANANKDYHSLLLHDIIFDRVFSHWPTVLGFTRFLFSLFNMLAKEFYTIIQNEESATNFLISKNQKHIPTQRIECLWRPLRLKIVKICLVQLQNYFKGTYNIII